MSQRYKPMLAKVAKFPFTDKDWIFEVKWDGFRAIAYINKDLTILSRNGKELRNNFPELEELKEQTHDVVLDGEIVILNQGKVDFQALLERIRKVSSMKFDLNNLQLPAVYIVFDILEKDGKPLINFPLIERKHILKEIIKEGAHVLLGDFIEEKGEDYYKAALAKGLEGIMAKKKDSLYEEGLRSDNWLKLKKIQSCDCAILGYTKGLGAREKTFGALLLGLYNKKGDPVYVGKVGTGFSQEELEKLSKIFQKIQTDEKPFKADILGDLIWLEPSLVCEVGYQIVTQDGRLRMPRFLRLRNDKMPIDCTINQLENNSPLKEYHMKRDFKVTKEPPGISKKTQSVDKIFVVQEHHARRLHFDFRLEHDGVLKSWAVPKGIPENTSDKRLAVETEDHPLDYAEFEGTIPDGNYGAGKVTIWDKGTYKTKVWSQKMVEFILNGKKLTGRYVLVRLDRGTDKNWLMLKGKE